MAIDFLADKIFLKKNSAQMTLDLHVPSLRPRPHVSGYF